jgi:large subunit ribosomal protein L13
MDSINPNDYEVFDAKGKIVGRLASTVAKRVLQGKKVAIINSESAIISGDRKSIIKGYKTKVNLMNKVNPDHSPYWPRRPDMLMKRIIRGMLPYRKPRGKTAYRNLRVFIGEPEVFKNAKIIEIESKDPRDMYVGYITMKELSRSLGYDKV